VGYLLKAGIGLALFLGSVIVFNVELQKLLDIGTCASGNTPYAISRPCPEGTGTTILLVMGSVVTGLVGCAIFAFRGDPPWGERKRSFGFLGLGALAWGIFFAGTGAALLIGQPYGEITDPQTGEAVSNAGSQLGSTITGITFLIMGLPPLLLGVWNAIRGIGRDERPRASGSGAGRTPSASLTGRPGGAGSIGKIERLQKLREDGAITDSEFEQQKARILSE
jgi:Short C-terminal domain